MRLLLHLGFLSLFYISFVLVYLCYVEQIFFRDKNNQTSHMKNENQGYKMVYFIKIIEKIFIYWYFGFTFQNPSSRVIIILTKFDIKI